MEGPSIFILFTHSFLAPKYFLVVYQKLFARINKPIHWEQIHANFKNYRKLQTTCNFRFKRSWVKSAKTLRPTHVSVNRQVRGQGPRLCFFILAAETAKN